MNQSRNSETLFKSSIIQAGAGAGKTHGLIEKISQLVLDFYENEKSYPRLIVSTFTRKATQEIRERILKKAISLEISGDAKGKVLIDYVTSSGSLHISTLHGVFSLFLSRYGKALGLDPSFQLASGTAIEKIKKTILKDLISENNEFNQLLDIYSLFQLQNFFDQLYVLKIEHKEIQPAHQNIFTHFQLETFKILHDNLNFILKNPPEKAPKGLADNLILLSKLMKEFSQDYDDNYKKIQQLTKEISRWSPGSKNWIGDESFSLVKAQLKKFKEDVFLNPQVSFEYGLNLELVDRVFRIYSEKFESQKINFGLLELSDLELLTAKAIQDFPESANSFSEEWDFWFIDEYQDTSPLQVEILKSLVGKKGQYIVGDPQQSIYLFRGARETVFENQRKLFEQQNAQTEVWTINRRSRPEMLYFINSVMTRMASNRFLAMEPWLADHRPLHDVKKTVADFLIVKGDSKELRKEEINATFFRVAELLSNGARPEDIAVLVRTNKDLFDLAMSAKSFGIDLEVGGSGQFFKRREIIDAQAMLRFLINPHDNTNTVGLLRSPWFFVSDGDLFKTSWRGSFWSSCLTHLQHEPSIQSLKSALDSIKETGLVAAFDQLILNSKIIEFSRLLDPSGRRESAVWKIISLVKKAEMKGPEGLLKIFDQMDLSPDESSETDAISVLESNRVKLMTVHASKGLEFPHVILPFLNYTNRASGLPSGPRFDEDSKNYFLPLIDEEGESHYPSMAKEISQEHAEQTKNEKLRVFYVALTRAIETVSLIWRTESKEVFNKSANAVETVIVPESGIAEMLKPLFDLSAGFHNLVHTDFTYQVREGFFSSEQKYKQIKVDDQPVRKRLDYSSETINRQKLSVTHLVERKQGEVEVKRERSQPGNSLFLGLEKARFGTEIHKFFESLKYQDYYAVIERLQRNGSPIELIDGFNYIWNNENIPFQEILENGFVEWGFNFNFKNFEIEGQIDLWGVDSDNNVWIIDYKTGSTQYLEKAFLQLKYYAWALAKCQRIRLKSKVHLAVIYPIDQKVFQKSIENNEEFFREVDQMLV